MYLTNNIRYKKFKYLNAYEFLKERSHQELVDEYNTGKYDGLHYGDRITGDKSYDSDYKQNYVTDLSFIKRLSHPVRYFWLRTINTNTSEIADIPADNLIHLQLSFSTKYISQLKRKIHKDLSFVTMYTNLEYLFIAAEPTSPIEIKNVVFPKLKSLWTGYNDTTKIDFSSFPNLKGLITHNRTGTVDSFGFSQLTQLKSLSLAGFPERADLSFLQNLQDLEFLSISSKGVVDFPDLSNLTKLKWVNLTGCKNIASYENLAKAPNLMRFEISGKLAKDYDLELFRPLAEHPKLHSFGYFYDYQPAKEEKLLAKMFEGKEYKWYQIYIVEDGTYWSPQDEELTTKLNSGEWP